MLEAIAMSAANIIVPVYTKPIRSLGHSETTPTRRDTTPYTLSRPGETGSSLPVRWSVLAGCLWKADDFACEECIILRTMTRRDPRNSWPKTTGHHEIVRGKTKIPNPGKPHGMLPIKPSTSDCGALWCSCPRTRFVVIPSVSQGRPQVARATMQ